MKKSNNKQMGESSSKESNPEEKEYTFPSTGIIIKATSLEEARKKHDKEIGKSDADDGDK